MDCVERAFSQFVPYSVKFILKYFLDGIMRRSRAGTRKGIVTDEEYAIPVNIIHNLYRTLKNKFFGLRKK